GAAGGGAPRPGGARAGGGGGAPHDEERRWVTFRRGEVRVAVNLSAEPVTIALGRNGVRVLAAWEPVEHPGPDGRIHVPGESAVVLGP
ncbi:DUF3459 domain-containing protein, partial [Streptomyces sp. NPDC059982]|uniref:DUF3459 domain-containing protein n=1 Tax=Streptomyces sp. NPDC059982 TaxID=3347024 RepID=UPI003688FC20